MKMNVIESCERFRIVTNGAQFKVQEHQRVFLFFRQWLDLGNVDAWHPEKGYQAKVFDSLEKARDALKKYKAKGSVGEWQVIEDEPIGRESLRPHWMAEEDHSLDLTITISGGVASGKTHTALWLGDLLKKLGHEVTVDEGRPEMRYEGKARATPPDIRRTVTIVTEKAKIWPRWAGIVPNSDKKEEV